MSACWRMPWPVQRGRICPTWWRRALRPFGGDAVFRRRRRASRRRWLAAGVRFRDGRGPELVSQEAVSRLDGAVVAEMCRLHRERGIDVIEARQLPEVREMLLRHRRMMNRPGGYWIAGFAPEAARHGTHRVYRREELSRVVLFSDGFSGQREALLGAEEPCLQELYRQLRQREAADSRCNRYPRLKPGDDVSGIVAVF